MTMHELKDVLRVEQVVESVSETRYNLRELECGDYDGRRRRRARSSLSSDQIRHVTMERLI
jgi:hypothetical protein